MHSKNHRETAGEKTDVSTYAYEHFDFKNSKNYSTPRSHRCFHRKTYEKDGIKEKGINLSFSRQNSGSNNRILTFVIFFGNATETQALCLFAKFSENPRFTNLGKLSPQDQPSLVLCPCNFRCITFTIASVNIRIHDDDALPLTSSVNRWFC